MTTRPRFALLVSATLLIGTAIPAGAWIQRFPDDDARFFEAFDVAIDATGDALIGGQIVTTGVTNFMTVSKLSGAAGDELWRRSFDPAPGAHGRAEAVAVNSSGDVVVGGEAGGSEPSLLVVNKLDGTTGADLWSYTKPSGAGARDVAFDAADDVVVGGRSNNELFVAKLDGATGAELWSFAIDSPSGNDVADFVAIDPSGDVVAAGFLDDLYVVKLDGTTGAVLWSILGDPDGSEVQSFVLDGAGDVVLAVEGGAVVKLNGASGAEEWRHPESVTALDVDGLDIIGSGAGVFRLAGATAAELWRLPPFTDNREVSHLTVSPGGRVFLGGERDFGEQSMFLASLDAATGALLWLSDYEGSDLNFEDRVKALAVDPTGDLVTVGRVFDKDRRFRIWIAKADQADGSLAGLTGQTIVFRDKDAGNPTKRRLKFLIKGEEVQSPEPGSLNDPISNGATIRLWNPSTLEEALIAAPAGPDWKGIGNPPGSNGYRYKDKTGVNPCKVSVRPFKNLKVTCKANNGPIPFSLDEATQGSLAASISFGIGSPQCASYGGLVVSDEPGQFKAKNAPPVGSCP